MRVLVEEWIILLMKLRKTLGEKLRSLHSSTSAPVSLYLIKKNVLSTHN